MNKKIKIYEKEDVIDLIANVADIKTSADSLKRKLETIYEFFDRYDKEDMNSKINSLFSDFLSEVKVNIQTLINQLETIQNEMD